MEEKKDREITLRQAQEMVDTWIHRTSAGYFSELTNMAVLSEEVGELARCISRTYGDQRSKPGEKLNIAEELADILWVLMALANQTGVDLTQALKESMEKKTKRDSSRFI